MKILTTVSEVNKFLRVNTLAGKPLGFVPTMGALHEGHISLISRAKNENEVVVCSIFVNPAQFNDKTDLINYPKTPDADWQKLFEAGCDFLFQPSVNEIYPEQKEFKMDFGTLETVMEGRFRTGHFNGVAKVVSRLFEIIQPTRAYFGEKDFQQLAIISEMNRRLELGVAIVGCSTLRDERGLAMSSRNIHLTPKEFAEAPVIYNTLKMAPGIIREFGMVAGKKMLIASIEKHETFKVQYLEFVDSITLESITDLNPSKSQRACIAVLTSKTRLIDNIAL